MTIMEYGQQNSNVIMLLHGGGLSWWNYREVAQKLAEQYGILPGLRHGDLSINNPTQYAQILTDWIRR